MWLSLLSNEGCVLYITINICTLIDAEQWHGVLVPHTSRFDPSPTNGVAGSSSRWPVPACLHTSHGRSPLRNFVVINVDLCNIS